MKTNLCFTIEWHYRLWWGRTWLAFTKSKPETLLNTFCNSVSGPITKHQCLTSVMLLYLAESLFLKALFPPFAAITSLLGRPFIRCHCQVILQSNSTPDIYRNDKGPCLPHGHQRWYVNIKSPFVLSFWCITVKTALGYCSSFKVFAVVFNLTMFGPGMIQPSTPVLWNVIKISHLLLYRVIYVITANCFYNGLLESQMFVF